MDIRGKKVALVAHCHLNVNTKIGGYADYPGARKSVILQLLDDDIGIIQLPCPEITHSGIYRWSCTYEQYDTVAYRETCQIILDPVITSLMEMKRAGIECVGVYGVDESPSCGVNTTCHGYEGGSLDELDSPPPAHMVAGRGVFIEELATALDGAGIDCEFYGVEERM